MRKTDNNRIARAVGATIVHRADEIRDSDIGTKAGLFEVGRRCYYGMNGIGIKEFQYSGAAFARKCSHAACMTNFSIPRTGRKLCPSTVETKHRSFSTAVLFCAR